MRNKHNDDILKKRHIYRSGTYGFYQHGIKDFSLSCGDGVQKAFGRALDASGLSCRQVADEVCRLAGVSIEPEQVRAWAVSDTYAGDIPLNIAGALVTVLNDAGFVRAAFEDVPGFQLIQGRGHLHESVANYGAAASSPSPRGHLVRAWMSANRHTTASVAQSLGVSPVAIRRWILGTMRSARIRQWFAENGCPEDVLGKE